MELSVDTKTVSASPLTTRMAIGKDLESGEVYAEEYGRQIRGQMNLEDYEKAQTPAVEAAPEDAEAVSDGGGTGTAGNVTDFRAAKEA